MALAITIATTDEELSTVYRLRYEVYVREMRRHSDKADHLREQLSDELDRHGYSLLALDDGRAVGTARWNLWRESELGNYETLYDLDKWTAHRESVGIVTKLMILKSHRGLGLSLSLTEAICRFGLERGIIWGFSDCNAHLVSLYEALGWRQYKGAVTHKDYGEITPMIFDGSDIAHLRQVNSPFAELASQFHGGAAQEQTYPQTGEHR